MQSSGLSDGLQQFEADWRVRHRLYNFLTLPSPFLFGLPSSVHSSSLRLPPSSEQKRERNELLFTRWQRLSLTSTVRCYVVVAINDVAPHCVSVSLTLKRSGSPVARWQPPRAPVFRGHRSKGRQKV